MYQTEVCLCEVKYMLLIGARLQEYRKNSGLSQEEFAEKVGVSRHGPVIIGLN